MTKFIYKEAPKAPDRITHIRHVYVHCGQSLAELINDLPANVDHSNACFYLDEYDNHVEFSELESDANYQKRIEKYRKDVEKYDEWCIKNKAKIEIYLREKEEAAKQKRIRELEDVVKSMRSKEKELEKLKKQYEKVTKEINN